MKIKLLILTFIPYFMQCGDSGNLQRTDSNESIPATVILPESPPNSPRSGSTVYLVTETTDYNDLTDDDSDISMENEQDQIVPEIPAPSRQRRVPSCSRATEVELS